MNNTNQTNESVVEKVKVEEIKGEGAENLLSTVTRGIAITPERFNSSKNPKKCVVSSNKKAKHVGKSSNKKKKPTEENKKVTKDENKS